MASSYYDSTHAAPAAPIARATPHSDPCASGRIDERRTSAGAFEEVGLDEAIAAFDGSTSSFPLIRGYRCPECGSGRPGGGVHRQSQAMVTTAGGITVRRGGKCRTCRRASRRAHAVFTHVVGQHMQALGRGLDYPARKAAMADAIVLGRVAMWREYVAVAERAARKAVEA